MSLALIAATALLAPGGPSMGSQGRLNQGWDFDGQRVLGAVGKEARLWNCRTGHLLQTFRGSGDVVSSVVFTPGGRQILTGTGMEGETHPEPDDTSIRLWDIFSGKEIRSFKGLRLHAHSISVNADRTRLLAVGGDSVAMVWDFKTARQLFSIPNVHSFMQPPSIPDAAFSADGRTITVLDSFKITLLNAETGQEILKVSGPLPGTQLGSVSLSQDGKWLVIAQTERGSSEDKWNHAVAVYDARTGSQVRRFDANSNWMLGALFCDSGHKVVALGMTQLQTWDVQTGRQLMSEALKQDFMQLAVNSRGAKCMVSCMVPGVSIWNLNTGRKIDLVANKPPEFEASIGFSPDGGTILTRYGNPEGVALWYSDSGKLIRQVNLEGLVNK